MKVFYLLLFILSVGYAFDPLMKSGFTQLVRIKKRKILFYLINGMPIKNMCYIYHLTCNNLINTSIFIDFHTYKYNTYVDICLYLFVFRTQTSVSAS